MKKPLSYSGYEKYMTCPHAYKLHYIDKIRPIITPFHLIFGSAVDKALNAVLESKPDPIDYGTLELARLITDEVDFDESNYDEAFLNNGPLFCIIEELKTLGWMGKDPNSLANFLFQKRNAMELSPNQSLALKTLVFYSAREHVKLIIQSFEKHIIPKLERIVSVQRTVKRGILDFEAEVKGIEGVVIFDNKTAARPYKPDAVKWSVQHASYGALTGAYVVFDKSQRGPNIIPQLIIQKVPPHNVELVEQAFQAAEKGIEAGHFPRNLKACGKQYGKPCVYADLCWGNSMKGLKKHD